VPTAHTKNKSFKKNCLPYILQKWIGDAYSQAAKLQARLGHRSDLLTRVVDFADAAYDANKKEQILLASRLLDVDCYLLDVSHRIIDDIVHNPTAYLQAGICGIGDGLKTTAHMLTHPVETINGLGKAIYYVLETAALNSSELVLEFPEVYEPMRDARNAEIAAGLEKLGDKIANSTGPERFRALVGFGTDFKVSGKIIHAVGDVCGLVKEQARVLRTLEGAVSMIEDERIAQQVIQAAEKMEAAAQEAVAKNVVSEFIDARKVLKK